MNFLRCLQVSPDVQPPQHDTLVAVPIPSPPAAQLPNPADTSSRASWRCFCQLFTHLPIPNPIMSFPASSGPSDFRPGVVSAWLGNRCSRPAEECGENILRRWNKRHVQSSPQLSSDFEVARCDAWLREQHASRYIQRLSTEK